MSERRCEGVSERCKVKEGVTERRCDFNERRCKVRGVILMKRRPSAREGVR